MQNTTTIQSSQGTDNAQGSKSPAEPRKPSKAIVFHRSLCHASAAETDSGDRQPRQTAEADSRDRQQRQTAETAKASQSQPRPAAAETGSPAKPA